MHQLENGLNTFKIVTGRSLFIERPGGHNTDFEASSPLVSIIMSVKNGQQFIHEAIDSIINQTYKNWELLIFNDGSTDGTLERLHFYEDLRIVIFSDTISLGLPKRLNFLIAQAKGDFIARMDADDIMLSDRLQLQVDFLQKNRNIDVVGSYALEVDEKGSELRLRVVAPIVKDAKELSIRNHFLIHPSLMIRKSFYLDNLYDPLLNRAEDYDLWLRTFNKYSFAVIKQPLIKYRIYKQSYQKLAKSHSVGIKAIKKNGKQFKRYDFYLVLNYFRLKYILHSTLSLLYS
jgi:glycosyltransferase involved in cell wall biosynthesis